MEYWEEQKMKRLSRIRLCKSCSEIIDNSKRKMHKRTKFCSEDCADDYNEERRQRRLGICS